MMVKIKSLIVLISGLLLIVTTACGGPGTPGSSDPVRFYVGSSDGNIEHSIYLCELDPVNQKLSLIDSFPGASGSGYLDLTPNGLTLIATSGISLKGDEGHNSVASYRVDSENQSLELINRQSSQGRGNCHVQSSPDGKYVFAANYSSGHAVALPIDESGMLEPATSVVVGEGSGPNLNRQKSPHAHQVMMNPGGEFLLVPDLGTDKIMNYAFDSESGVLSPNPNQPFLKMEPGSGPRHLAFHPDKNLVYILAEMSSTVTACTFDSKSGVLNPNPKQAFLNIEPGSGPRHLAFHPEKNLVYILSEMSSSVTACTFDPKSGVLEIISTSSIVEENFTGKLQAAAIRIHPNGKYVYASNRDDDSNLAVFNIESDGALKQTQIIRNIPYWPRDFNLTPDGDYLLVAGARANEIALYSVDKNTGALEKMNASIKVPAPTSIVFIP
jgi:6-phosphogluconolactonase